MTSLPKFPSAYELTDSGDAELAPAIATADEMVYTVGDTRVYPLPPVDGVDGEAGPDSEVAQYFNGRPNALSDDVILGALARAVYQVTPPAARPGTDDATPAAGAADSTADGDADSGADAASEGELDADPEAATDATPEPDTDVEADAEPVMAADVDTPRHKAGLYGCHVKQVEARGTIKKCASCGVETPKPIWVREHSCPSCGFECDRDANAAMNVLQRGFAKLGLGWPESTPVDTVTATDTAQFESVSASHVIETGSLPS